ncbi:Protein EXECUTER 1 chloroplastic [Zea mays]|uniref:Protein EXECUTER 1 chloroplastic n=1 Tax=Zea mays TaxID=4577 RepID=A0A1D6KSL6_MAIZE|nr:Protein EXECUTER 1 chloroplastic [Zea mays]
MGELRAHHTNSASAMLRPPGHQLVTEASNRQILCFSEQVELKHLKDVNLCTPKFRILSAILAVFIHAK